MQRWNKMASALSSASSRSHKQLHLKEILVGNSNTRKDILSTLNKNFMILAHFWYMQ